MRLSRPVRESTQQQQVLEFVLPHLSREVAESVTDFVETAKKSKNEFRPSETTRVQTGLDLIETRSIEEDVEKKVLEQVKETQEKAYQEAYQLGLIEGKKEAFAVASSEIHSHLKGFEQLLESMLSTKKEMLQQNEGLMVKMLLQAAACVAFHEVTVNQEALSEMLKALVDETQSEEKIVIRVNPEHIAFLEELQKKSEFNLEFLKRSRFVPEQGIQKGGCVIETGYGETDAQIEKRVKKLMEAFDAKLFPVKNEIRAA